MCFLHESPGSSYKWDQPPGGLVDKRLGSRAQGPEFETRRGDGNLTKAYPLEKKRGQNSVSAHYMWGAFIRFPL